VPPDGAFEIEAAGESLWLLPQCAIYWPRMEALLIADAHLGKAAAFRNGGIPVPSGTTNDNLDRLTALVHDCGAGQVIFLGDLVHSAAARRAATGAFAEWRECNARLEVMLVRGNHDRRSGAVPGEWRMTVVEEPHTVGPLALCHAPMAVPGSYAMSGHTHPCVQLHGRGREHLRLPCFWFTTSYAVLPAFGAFTGMAEVEPAENDRVYVAAGKRVVSLNHHEH
jgi:DNA ligase-associated metallophosphoesterase